MSDIPARAGDWYKDAVIYEVRLRSFFDANGDGIGDFAGLIEKLDYIQDLGVDTIWVLPFYPSPLVDDGYDIADYREIHPDLGTLREFKRLLHAAHDRGLRVVTELVLNHTSDQHAWFQRARRAPKGSRYRNFYVWSDDTNRYQDARIIFQDFETSNWTWDPVAQAYFWHRFYANQPDLNFDNPEVQKEVMAVVDFWLGLGIDGLRLDAVPYLFEREGTNCENLPETHGFLKKLRAHMDKKFPGRMLLAEANQWPEDAVAYFGEDNECHMCFHFPIMPRLFMGLRMEDSFPILDILEQTPAIPPGCQWAIFLRNHDELTLEMVTDEERDYMVGAYAANRRARVNLGIRRRLAPLMENHRQRIELMNALLFSLPGTPVLYYGDEIGMGDNIYLGDRNGVRTPMQWNGDRNAGFSKANPQSLVLPPISDPEYHYAAVNVEAQQENPSSLLWWTKRMIGLRRRHQAFGRGSFEALHPANRKVLAFLRRTEEEVLLIVVNLSRFAQHVELELAHFEGRDPIELFGATRFPTIGAHPYSLSMSPHGFYWLSLGASGQSDATGHLVSASSSKTLTVSGSLDDIIEKRSPALLRSLPRYLQTARWYRDKARQLSAVRIEDDIPLGTSLRLLLLRTEFASGEPSYYLLPVALFAAGDRDAVVLIPRQGQTEGKNGWCVVDASEREETANALLSLARTGRTARGAQATLVGHPERELRKLKPTAGHPLGAEQSNTSYRFGSEVVLKFLRQVDPGESVELQVLRHFQTEGSFNSVPRLLGSVELTLPGGGTSTAAILQSFEESRGDAFGYMVDFASQFIHAALPHGAPDPGLRRLGLGLHPTGGEAPALVADLLGGFLPQLALLGRRTAEMHQALAGGVDAEFRPEPWGALSKRAYYQSLRNLMVRAKDGLKVARSSLDEATSALAQLYDSRQKELATRFTRIRDGEVGGRRIRVHGDYHLGQVLHTGKDFIILDFEGEPARSLSFRRSRRSPLADVAGMIRSFHYAAWAPLVQAEHGVLRHADLKLASAWLSIFSDWTSAVFVEAYLSAMGDSELIPKDGDLAHVLQVHILEKAIYELVYELGNRPSWAQVPLHGIIDLLEDHPPT